MIVHVAGKRLAIAAEAALELLKFRVAEARFSFFGFENDQPLEQQPAQGGFLESLFHIASAAQSTGSEPCRFTRTHRLMWFMSG
jgi:hypothetical protein